MNTTTEEHDRRENNRKRAERRKLQKARNREKQERRRKQAEQHRLERAVHATSHLPPPNAHCLARWGERFRPDECFYHCYSKSAVVSWETLLAAARSNGLAFRLSSACTYRYHPPSGAVFVIGRDGQECRTVVRYQIGGIL